MSRRLTNWLANVTLCLCVHDSPEFWRILVNLLFLPCWHLKTEILIKSSSKVAALGTAPLTSPSSPNPFLQDTTYMTGSFVTAIVKTGTSESGTFLRLLCIIYFGN